MKKFTHWLEKQDAETFEWLNEGLFNWSSKGGAKPVAPPTRAVPTQQPSVAHDPLDQFQYPPYKIEQHHLEALKDYRETGKGDLSTILNQISSTRGYLVANMVKRAMQGDASGADRMQQRGAADWASGNSR